MCRTSRFRNVAYKCCDFSDKQNIVAVIEKGGSIKSIASNDMSRTHPIYYNGEYDKGIHAEYAAIRKANNVEGCNIHVYYFRRAGDLGNSKPCPYCMIHIKKAGIRSIFYHLNGKKLKLKV